MYLFFLMIISGLTAFAITMFVVATKLTLGANANNIAKGKPTRSRDELRRSIRVVRIVMSAITLVCVAMASTVLWVM